MVRLAFLDYAWLIPAFPALAAALIALFGLRTPEKGGWLAVMLVGFAGATSLGVFWEGLRRTPVTWDAPFIRVIEWWSVGDFTVNVGLYIDPLTILMLFTVGILVTLITLYSTAYMHEEGPGRRRYYAELTLFITGMLGLVVSSNYLQLFIFWEIMGLCSYLLIGYWFTKPSAASASKKAFLTTRVGDAFFLIGLGILFTQFGTLDFDALFAAAANGAPGVDRGMLLLANACIFAGAVGKSAQFPLHTWLPDAMEGPTTVSALIHAATMVKAGVFLVARSFPLFVLTPELLVVVAIVGGFTALFAATLALTNWDLKRVLAYSTLSQLGYMFLGLGVAGVLYVGGANGAAVGALATTALALGIFHLFSHAFFKAGLFLAAGSVGHAVHSFDMRVMGGMQKHMPVTAFAMLMGTLSISGIPLFAGFFSKDAIIYGVYSAGKYTGSILYWVLFGVAVLTAALTAYYMFRLYFLTFTGRYRGPAWLEERKGAYRAAHSKQNVGAPSIAGHHPDEDHAPHASQADAHGHHKVHLHESPWTMSGPLAFLGLFAVIGGFVAFAIAGGSVGNFIAPDSGTMGSIAGHLGVTPEQVTAYAHPALGVLAAAIQPFTHMPTYIGLAAVAIGIGTAWFMWAPSKVEANIRLDEEASGITRLWQQRYHIDRAYDHAFGKAVLAFARVNDWFDREVVDGAVNGVATVNYGAADRLRRWNTGNVQDYALTVLGGFILIVLIVIYMPQIPGFIEFVRNFVGAAFAGGGS